VVLSPRRRLAVAAMIAGAWLLGYVVDHAASATTSRARDASAHFACSRPSSSKVPCHFSTPSGNIRCLWTPTPDNVACELFASGRGYRLRPTGKAQAVRLTLHRRGETLPTNQQLVFPQSLSCHDTKTTMTCNQNFGLGFFKLARKGSRSS
jgi:hypothetical protein